jgi:hypothetical protein
MENKINEWLKSLGIRDFDDLRDNQDPILNEKKTYFELLDIAEKGKITLEEVKKHVHQMRMSVEFALVDEPQLIHSKILPFLKRTNPRMLMLQARLKNYILFENLFDRPERAKEMLDQYMKVKGVNKI